MNMLETDVSEKICTCELYEVCFFLICIFTL